MQFLIALFTELIKGINVEGLLSKKDNSLALAKALTDISTKQELALEAKANPNRYLHQYNSRKTAVKKSTIKREMITPSKKESEIKNDDLTGVVSQFLTIFRRLKDQIPHSIREMIRILYTKASCVSNSLPK